MESSNRLMRTLLRATVLVAVLLALGPATAQGRTDYRRIPTGDGFLEVETSTGAVRECKRSVEGYRCTASTPDKLQSEVERLTRENDELRRRVDPGTGGTSPLLGLFWMPFAVPPRQGLLPETRCSPHDLRTDLKLASFGMPAPSIVEAANRPAAEQLLLTIGRAGVLSCRAVDAGEFEMLLRLLGPLSERQRSDLRRATDIVLVEDGAVIYWPRTGEQFHIRDAAYAIARLQATLA
jgi:hypothetical protein